MPRRSKIAIAGYADQVKSWLEEGKQEEWIAAQLNQRGTNSSFTQQDVNRFKHSVLKRVQVQIPEERIAEAWTVDRVKAEQILDELIQLAMGTKEMTFEVRNAFRSKLEAVREKLKVLGAYAPTTLTQVAVQVNQGPDLKKRLWAILGDETIGENG